MNTWSYTFLAVALVSGALGLSGAAGLAAGPSQIFALIALIVSLSLTMGSFMKRE